jgi:hypothetical protein
MKRGLISYNGGKQKFAHLRFGRSDTTIANCEPFIGGGLMFGAVMHVRPKMSGALNDRDHRRVRMSGDETLSSRVYNGAWLVGFLARPVQNALCGLGASEKCAK